MPEDVADLIHSLRIAEIPEAARQAGRRVLLDTLGAAAIGARTLGLSPE